MGGEHVIGPCWAKGRRGIDGKAAGVIDLVVKVCARREACVVGMAQELAACDALAAVNRPVVEVHVGGTPTCGGADFDGTSHASGGIFVGPENSGICCGVESFAVIGFDVDAPVGTTKEGVVIFGAVVEVDVAFTTPLLRPAAEGVVGVDDPRVVACRVWRIVVVVVLADGEGVLTRTGAQRDEGAAE